MLWLWAIGALIVFCLTHYYLAGSRYRSNVVENSGIAVISILWPFWIVGAILVLIIATYGILKIVDALDEVN